MVDNELKEKKYLPFHAVNEFMRDDFKLMILQEILSNLETCSQQNRSRINKLISKGVKLQGFRNASLAPVAIKARGSISLFEKSPEFVSAVLECWSSFHPDLKKGMHQVLAGRGWELLPYENDRSELPGFQVEWPKIDSFEELVKSTRDSIPTCKESDDEISLMAVWLGNRLPYDLYEQRVTG